MMIAGMAIALEKSSKSYRNGERLNKLAIARAVAQNLANLGISRDGSDGKTDDKPHKGGFGSHISRKRWLAFPKLM